MSRILGPKTIALVTLSLAAPATAQTAPADNSRQPTGANANGNGEIIVTARKRSETLISVPVVVSAVPAAELQRRAINNLDGIARVVPQLIIAPSGGSVQGGTIAIRGISGPDTNPFGDQAVSFNIDGVQVAKSFVRRMSDTDIDQVEVLKGPQALFFGKNSPAGIISIRTADPTSKFEAKASVGYEIYAHEVRSEGYVSGPISDTLGFRVAGYYSHMDGYLLDQTPASSVYAPDHDRTPHSSDFALRGTLKWTPDSRFRARLKLNYSQTRNPGPEATVEYTACPFGVRQSGSGGPCGVGRNRITDASSGPFLGTIPSTLGSFGDGQNFQHQKQFLGSLELNYDLTDNIALTSVTGYYWVKLNQCQNYEVDTSFILPSCNPLKDKEFSQELKATTSFDSPINFTGGLYFASTHAATGSITWLYGGNFDLLGPGIGGPTTPFLVNDYYLKQNGKAYSAYLQMIFKPVDVIEVDIGGRYSHETKNVPLVLSSSTSPILTPADAISLAVNKRSWNDFSPEATISYRPTRHLTVFGSYKHGFLSGGFNSSSTGFVNGADISYNPETIKGFEAGIKAETADGALRVNLTAYTYKVKDLQVTGFTNATSTINNAGAVSIKGLEGDFSYRTPLRGLTINGSASYNHARYTSFPAAPCYNGQTQSAGCFVNALGVATQNLGGTELIRAPKWILGGGFDFERKISEGFKFGLSAAVNYSSSFLTDVTSDPYARMPKYALVDATARISQADDRWELAIIGRNLTDKYYFVSGNDVPFTGGPAGGVTGTLADRDASVSRGREVMVRVSYKFM